ncbi:MAG: type II toxin-antitoxin system RelB/DinJ family antitoxin [Burkholderiales bacterium]|nr:type II toxin-antitoxin system RelB/DinJ family antitoxin [Burkholderiales bacterium]
MANLQVRIDDKLKAQAQIVAESMGLDLTQAVRMFLHQMVRENGLPSVPWPILFLVKGICGNWKKLLKI